MTFGKTSDVLHWNKKVVSGRSVEAKEKHENKDAH